MKNAVLETTTQEPTEALQYHRMTLRRTITTASPIPSPIPIPWPVLSGSRFLIWMQDPAVGAPGLHLIYMPGMVLDGPRDSRITTVLPGTTPVHKDIQGDFVFPYGTPEFDCAQTYAVARLTLNMYQRVLRDLGVTAIPWAWNTGGITDPLTVFPRAGNAQNAHYSRSGKELSFYYFTTPSAPTPVYTCRSLDVVAHETGHAILDGLKPGWLSAGNPPQTGGLHESFGDLTAVFLALSMFDQVAAAIALSKANLHDRASFVAALAEQFGLAIGMPHGIRNADNDLKLSQVGNEVHAISQVFTGAIYDVLADIFAFEKNRQAATKEVTLVLYEVSAHLCKVLVQAIRKAPGTGATFADVGNQMLVVSHDMGDPPIYRTFIRNQFAIREILLPATPYKAVHEGSMNWNDPNFVEGKDLLKLDVHHHAADKASQNRSTCCGTMQMAEYLINNPKLMETGIGLTDDDVLAPELKDLAKVFK